MKGLEDAFLVVLNLIDEVENLDELKEKIKQYYTWILERRIDKIRTMLENNIY